MEQASAFLGQFVELCHKHPEMSKWTLEEIKQLLRSTGKKVSQYTVRLWLDLQSEDLAIRELATEDYKILTMGSSGEIIALLKARLGVDLNRFDVPIYVYSDWSAYGAAVVELPNKVASQAPIGHFALKLPVPPRPTESMAPTEVLEQWVDSDPDKPPFFPQHPYIPLSFGG